MSADHLVGVAERQTTNRVAERKEVLNDHLGAGVWIRQIWTRQGLDSALDFLADPLTGNLQIVLRLQVLPQLRTRS
jgi:hypothetical protein